MSRMHPDPDYSDLEHDSLDIVQDSLEPCYAFPKDDLLYDSLQPVPTGRGLFGGLDAGFPLGAKIRFNPLSFHMPGIGDDDQDYEEMLHDHRAFDADPREAEGDADAEQKYSCSSEYIVAGGEFQTPSPPPAPPPPQLVDVPMLRRALRASRDDLRDERPTTPVLSLHGRGGRKERDGEAVKDELADSDFDSFERKRSETESASTDSFYDTPEGDVYDPSLPYIPPALQLKTALKTGFKASRLSVNFEDDIYDPSLPPIPLLDAPPAPALKSALKGSVSSRRSAGSDLSEITSVSPALDDWHEALGATARMGWAILLYHAVRNNFKPRAFAHLAFQGSREFVRAIADYMTTGSTLLNFKKGDIIRIITTDQFGDNGWLQGTLDGRSGLFPMEYVVPIGRSEARNAAKERVNHVKTEDIDPGLIENESEVRSAVSGTTSTWTQPPQHMSHNHNLSHNHNHTLSHDDSGHSSGGEGGGGGGGRSGSGASGSGSQPVVHDGKHSLLQFALQHFRMSKEQGIVQSDGTLQASNNKNKKKKTSKDQVAEWTWKEQVEMVKFSQSPLTASLLPLVPELDNLAIETFVAVMRYMGDYPMAPQQTEVHCVYTILMNCHKHHALRDEVYCQIMKQTTNNKSSIPDSCQRGWRLFSIVAAYFTCSENLKPYLFKYLETAAYDKRRAYHGTSMVCLQNLRKTFKYGGRKNVPSIEEITAITAGRNSKRQIYRLPGGTERVINTKSTSVVQDIIEEMCSLIGVRNPHEQEEYSLYCIVEGDTFTMPLAREEYILDVTTELLKNQQVFYLIFCRSVWYYPLRSDNALYYEVVFNQIAPDYLEGLLLVTPGEQLQQDVIYDIAKVAALLHRAADLEDVPTMKEVKYLLPKPALTVRDVKPPQWVNMVQSAWPEVSALTSLQAKAQVPEILQSWPLFGSSFFAVKRVTEPKERSDHILALNKNGVHFLDLLTHETLIKYSLAEVMSTRKVKSEDELYLDMKCGNLMQQRITRIQTEQAHEISRLIRQYITIEQRTTGHSRGDNPKDVTLSR
nr:unconventional myosin-XV-like [Penaeus vannamei]